MSNRQPPEHYIRILINSNRDIKQRTSTSETSCFERSEKNREHMNNKIENLFRDIKREQKPIKKLYLIELLEEEIKEFKKLESKKI